MCVPGTDSINLILVLMYTLFYAEDDQDDVFLFKSVLEEMDIKHQLIVASNGQILMDYLYNPPPTPHLIFMDLNMPVKNGMDSLREIRENEMFGKIPVVILSTSSDERSIQQAGNFGADLYIVKPESYSKLREYVGACLKIDWFNGRSEQLQVFSN